MQSHPHIHQFPVVAWIFWVNTDVWGWVVCAIVVDVSQRVLLNRFSLNGLKQARQPAFEQCDHSCTVLCVSIRIEPYNVDLASPALCELLSKDTEHAGSR